MWYRRKGGAARQKNWDQLHLSDVISSTNIKVGAKNSLCLSACSLLAFLCVVLCLSHCGLCWHISRGCGIPAPNGPGAHSTCWHQWWWCWVSWAHTCIKKVISEANTRTSACDAFSSCHFSFLNSEATLRSNLRSSWDLISSPHVAVHGQSWNSAAILWCKGSIPKRAEKHSSSGTTSDGKSKVEMFWERLENTEAEWEEVRDKGKLLVVAYPGADSPCLTAWLFNSCFHF